MHKLGIAALERTFLAEQMLSTLRHDLRNKHANIHNATYYIRRQIEQGHAASDPRVARFLWLIEEELAAAERLLRSAFTEILTEESLPLDLRRCVLEAVRLAAPAASVVVDHQFRSLAIPRGDSQVVTLLIRCVIDAAVLALSEGGFLSIATSDHSDGVMVSVRDSRTSSVAVDEFKFAEQIAARCRAQLCVASVPQGVLIELLFPTILP